MDTATKPRSEGEGAPAPSTAFEYAYQKAIRRKRCSREDFAAGYKAALDFLQFALDVWLKDFDRE